MPSLASYPSREFVKLLYIGNSGAGKTGSLTSLVAAGYRLRVLDMDANMDSLLEYVMKECPDKAGNVEYETLRDEWTVAPMITFPDVGKVGPRVKGNPKAYANAIKLLEKWTDGSDPSEWGPDTVLVIDSLTRLSDAAFNWATYLDPSTKDPRQWYGKGQASIEHVLSLLSDKNFHCNVIIICHIHLSEQADGVTKAFPKSVGRALGPIIPTYFPTLVLAESTGAGANVKRKIKTLPTTILDLKNPKPFAVDAEYPLETGLAQLFNQLKAK